MKTSTLLFAALLSAPAALAQTTGSVGIGTATPNAKAALDVSATDKGVLVPRLTQAQRTAIAAPVPVGLLVYQTDGSTTGFWYYEATAGWTSLSGGSSTGDNLGNHSATQTLNLNAQRLLGSVGTSLGDSIAQVELNASVGTQSTALITRSNFGARYSRVMLSGYGKLPDGTSTANDYGIWATAYRGGGWAGFFSAGSTTTPLRWVGICQNPGYNSTGSAIRIVDGTQGAGKVLTSDNLGYGTWRTLAVTAATGNFNLGPYYLVGNGGSTGIAISSAGRVGINTTTPYSQLANTATNIIGSDGAGGNPGSLTWAADQAGYVGMFYNDGTAGNANGLAVKVAATGTAAALDVSQGTTQDVAGIPLLRVQASGNVGIGTGTPGAGLHVVTGNGGVASGAGAFLSGPPTGNPNLELRGGTTAVTPYVDLAETSGVDYSSRLLSSGGTLNVYGANATALKVNGNAAVTGSMTVNGVNVTSDRRFKTNVRPLGSALASVLALRGVRYEWNALGVQHGGTAGASQVGLLAQEVEQVYPELVSTGPDGYKAVNYAQLTPVLLEALKEQQAQIEALQKQNAALQAHTATAEAAAAQATSAAGAAKTQAAQATAALETFEARVRRLETLIGAEARK